MEQGHYWVKYDGHWQIAKCTGTNWYIAGVLGALSFDSFTEVEQNMIVRKCGFVGVDTDNPGIYG